MRSIVIGALFDALPAPASPACGSTSAAWGRARAPTTPASASSSTWRRRSSASTVWSHRVPLLLAGWSFGADVALATVVDRVRAWLAIAPPLRVVPDFSAVGTDPRPKLLVLAQHDEFRAPASVREATRDWVATDTEVIGGASHFFVGRTDRLVDLALAYADHPHRRLRVGVVQVATGLNRWRSRNATLRSILARHTARSVSKGPARPPRRRARAVEGGVFRAEQRYRRKNPPVDQPRHAVTHADLRCVDQCWNSRDCTPPACTRTADPRRCRHPNAGGSRDRRGALRARGPRRHDHLQPARSAQATRSTARCDEGLNEAFAASARGGRLGRDRDRAGRAFCAGGDVRGGGGNRRRLRRDLLGEAHGQLFESGWEIFKPVIAAVNGYCLGYGLTLVTWCDFVIASERAEFGFPEVRLGCPPSSAPSACRSGSAGRRHGAAADGRSDRRPRAREIGLAGWVVPHDELMDEARALADRLLRAAPLAVHAMKEVAMRTALPASGGDPVRRDDAQGGSRHRGRRRGPRAASHGPCARGEAAGRRKDNHRVSAHGGRLVATRIDVERA